MTLPGLPPVTPLGGNPAPNNNPIPIPGLGNVTPYYQSGGNGGGVDVPIPGLTNIPPFSTGPAQAPNPPGLPSIPQVVAANNPQDTGTGTAGNVAPIVGPGGATAHFSLMVIVGQIVFVCIMVLLSQRSPTMETLVTTVFVGLWLVFLINQGPNLASLLRIRK